MATVSQSHKERVDLPWEVLPPVAMAGGVSHLPDRDDCILTSLSAVGSGLTVVMLVEGMVRMSEDEGVSFTRRLGLGAITGIGTQTASRLLPGTPWFTRYGTFWNMISPAGTVRLVRATWYACEDERNGLKDKLKEFKESLQPQPALQPIPIKSSEASSDLWKYAAGGAVVLIGAGFLAESTILGIPAGLALQGAGATILVVIVLDSDDEPPLSI